MARLSKAALAQFTLAGIATRMVPALDPDRWSPAYPGGLVRLRVMLLPQGPRDARQWCRVCAWGADDTGMELDFFEDAIARAERWNRWLSNLAVVSQDMLRGLGFQWA